MDLERIQATLQRAGVLFEHGMTDAELRAIEERYELHFPPDLRQFLQHALPVSKGWLNWRAASERKILASLDWPYEGICFDVEHNAFWLDEWGARPSELEQAFAVVKRAIRQAPKLIPVRGHRFVPDRPFQAGNPVLSVYQTDIIYYGADLQDYLENEFSSYFNREGYRIREPVRSIELWSRLVENNG
jgi:hypothetical protein